MFQFAYSFYSITVILSILLSLAVFLQKPSKEQKVLQSLVFCILIMSIGYLGMIKAASLESAVWANKLIYFGGGLIFIIFDTFFLYYYDIKIPKWLPITVTVYKVVMMAFTLTFDHHTLFYKNYGFSIHNGIAQLTREPGIIYIIYHVEVLVCISLAVILNIKKLKVNMNNRREKSRIICLILTLIVPTITYCIQFLTNLPIDLTPIGLISSEIILLNLVYGLNICNVKDAAREQSFDSMDRAIILVDDNYNYQDANQLGKELFQDLKEDNRNKNIDEISQLLSDILHERKTTVISLGENLYQPNIKPLYENKHLTGYMALLMDVTEQQMYMNLLENYQKDLESDVLKKKSQIEKMQQQIIVSFATIAENRDGTTGKHIKRTSAYVDLIIKELVKEGLYRNTLTKQYCEDTYLAAPLHDIGKLVIPDGILCKPGNLTNQEFEVIKTHTSLGSKILDDTLTAIEGENYLEIAHDMALYHHERWDGSGYPDKLCGENIPLCARVMAVADVFDALVSERPYKIAYSMEAAFQIIQASKGTHFDPKIVDAFMAIRKKIEIVCKSINDTQESQIKVC